METVHVAFGESIADTISKALSLLGVAERVIGLPDCLSVGPIDPPEPNLRQAWGKSVLIGRTITKLSFENTPPGEGTGDVVLFGRMLALGDVGSLEVAGPGPGLRDYQVCRAVV